LSVPRVPLWVIIVFKMQDELLRKINDALSSAITTEMQVVYLLVEIRKLLDRDNYTQPTIRSFSNWVVHTSLEHKAEGTTQVLQEFDECVSLTIEENKGPGTFPQHYSLRNFRDGLQTFLAAYTLPTQLTDDDTTWQTFCRLYSDVVSDCPITLTASRVALNYIDKVELVTNMRLPDGYQQLPLLDWKVTLKSGRVMFMSIMM